MQEVKNSILPEVYEVFTMQWGDFAGTYSQTDEHIEDFDKYFDQYLSTFMKYPHYIMKKCSIEDTCEKLGISWNGIGYKKRKHSIQIREWKNDRTIPPPLKQTPSKNTTKSKNHNKHPIPKIPQIKIPHSCKTNRLMVYLWFY